MFKMAEVIYVFGDSVSWGYADFEKGGWVERLKNYFMEKGNNSIFVYNLGIESNTTEDLLVRFEAELKHRIYIEHVENYEYSSLVIFAIGKNDSLFIGKKDNTWVSSENFENNLNELIKKSRKYTDKIMLIGLGKCDETKTLLMDKNGESYCNENLIKYNNIIEKVCKDNNIIFISMQEVLEVNEDLYDGLHPNSKGHKKVFERVKEELNKILENN